MKQRGMIESFAVHKHPHFKDACAEVLNEEWPRSKTARLYSLEKSSDDLPYNIALVELKNDVAETVIGHSKLSKVHGKSAASFVESVVIAKNRRGQGLGRVLMEETEKHALNLGFTTLYLTTHDQQKFYEHMGYIYCKAVVVLGSATKLLSVEKLNKLLGDTTISSPQEASNHHKSVQVKGIAHTAQAVPEKCQNDMKTVTSAPPGPAPPPPPPCPPKTSNNGNIVRMNPADISWMKKDLQ